MSFLWKRLPIHSQVLPLVMLLIAGGSVAAAFYAQSLFTPNIPTLVWPAQIYLVSAAIFAIAFRLPPAAKLEMPPRAEHTLIRAALAGTGVTLFGIGVWQASSFTTGNLPLVLWPASLAFVLSGAATWPLDLSKLAPSAKALAKLPWGAIALSALIFAVALGIRLYRLADVPSVLIDESIGGYYALKTVYGKDFPIFVTIWESLANLPFIVEGVFYKWFGQSILALRLPYTILGALEVWFAYLLGKEIGGRRAGLISAALLAVLEVHVHFSRVAMPIVAGSFSSTGAAAFLARGIRRGSWLDWVLAGAIVGLGVNYSTVPRLLPFMLALFVVGLLVLRPRPLRWLLPGIAFVVVGLVVGTGPIAGFFLGHPEEYLKRTSESWLPLAITSLTNPSSLAKPLNVGELLWLNLERQTLGFNLFGDAHTWYREGRPMLGPLLSPVFFLGVAALTARLRDWRCLLVGVWLWVPLLLLGVGSNITPVFHRPVPLFATACVAAGVALSGFGTMVEKVFQPRLIRWSYWLAAAALVGVIGAQQLSDYFLNYAPRDNWPADDLLVRYLHDLGPENDVVMVGDYDHSAQSRLVQFGTRLGRKNASLDWKSDIPVKPTQSGRAFVFVVHYSRAKELPTIKALYPGGTVEELKAVGRLWWVVYKVTPAL